MKITFVSNYINHHQIPFSKAMSSMDNTEYTFIQTEKMEAQRSAMGWNADINELPFVKCFYEDKENCEKLIAESDVVIFGGTDEESYIMDRLEKGLPVIRYSERIYKEGQWKFISPRGLKKKYHDHIRFRKSDRVVMLCSGGYVASDFNLIKAYPGKLIRWGYFPEYTDIVNSDFARKHGFNENPEFQDIINFKQKEYAGRINILWAGRQIDWKHPEEPVKAARILKDKGLDFQLTMIGNGTEHEKLVSLVNEYHLEEYINFYDFMEPHKVRDLMIESQIFLFTSDQKEGWGAVLNESLNSGCAVIASDLIGAVPYLLRHEKNGMVYHSGNVTELAGYLEKLITDKELRSSLALNGYKTVRDMWNPENAAKRLRIFIDGFVEGRIECYEDDGPVSMAPVIKPSKGYDYCRK